MNIPDSDALLHMDVDKPYLGSPGVVEKILRDLLKGIIDIRGRQLQGESVNFQQEIDDMCLKAQAIFYGEDDQYSKSNWFSKNMLGVALVRYSGVGGKEDDAVYRVMLSMVSDFSAVYMDYEHDKIDDDEYNDKVNAIVELYITAILGMKKSK